MGLTVTDPATISSTPWWMAGSAMAGAIVLKVVEWFLRRHRDRASEDLVVAQARTEIALVEGLKARIAHLENRQTDLERRLTDEMDKRLQALEEGSRLRLRVLQLEVLLRANNIPVPADPFGLRADVHPAPESTGP